jgi:chromosome segregation ATPase
MSDAMKTREEIQQEIEALLQRSEQLQAQAHHLQLKLDAISAQMKTIEKRQAELIADLGKPKGS